MTRPAGRSTAGCSPGGGRRFWACRLRSVLQWLTPIIADYVRHRLPVAAAASAKVERDRLTRNLLSSQPLCFNVFGQLAAFPSAAGRVLSEVTGLKISSCRAVLVEHTPGPALALGDLSAFDAFVVMDTDVGREFLGVETKYTEPFSATRYERDTYVAVTDDPEGWFLPGSAHVLAHPRTNQLWRTAMLAQRTELGSEDLVAGHVMVLTAAGDATAERAVKALRKHLKQSSRLLHVLLEDLVAAAQREPELRAWATIFSARYLDVTR